MKIPGRIRWWHAALFYAVLLVVVTAVSHARRAPSSHAAEAAPSLSLSTQAARPTTHTPRPARNTPARPAARHRARPSPRPLRTSARPGRLTLVGRGIVLPDAKLTPGAVNPAVRQSTIYATICVSGYTSTIRPPSSYTTGLKIQQLNAGYNFHDDTHTGDYEEDHLISLELGGSPRSAKNLWPEPYNAREGARVKDEIENKLHSLVCDRAISLRTAQRAIARNWWRAYQHYIGLPATQPRTHSHAPPPAAPPPAQQQHACTATSSGSCIRGGEFCPQADYGMTGYDADGTAYVCTGDRTHPHWE